MKTNIKKTNFLFTLLSMLSLSVCLPLKAELQVVATLPDLAAIAKDIGGKHVSVKALSSPKQDPHYVDPRPSLIVKLSKADLLIVNGLELEVGWLPPLQLNSRNSKIQIGQQGFLDVSTSVRKMEIPQMRISRSQGDIHPGGNPHFTFDPRAGLQIAQLIRDRLNFLDPSHAKDFKKNFQFFSSKAESLIKKERDLFKKIPNEKRNVISYHRSLTYLFDWLRLSRALNIEPQPGIPPNPSHVAKVLKTMRANKVSLIIQEDYFPTNSSKTLAKLGKAKLVLIPGATNFQAGQSYLEHIESISQGIYNAIEK